MALVDFLLFCFLFFFNNNCAQCTLPIRHPDSSTGTDSSEPNTMATGGDVTSLCLYEHIKHTSNTDHVMFEVQSYLFYLCYIILSVYLCCS